MNLSDADKRRLRDAFAVKATLNGNLMTVIGLDDALGDLDIQTRALDIDAGSVAGGSLRDLLAGAIRGGPAHPD